MIQFFHSTRNFKFFIFRFNFTKPKGVFMKKGISLLFIAFAFFSEAFVNVPSAAAQNNNSITGFVFNSSRQPVADVYVELQSDLNTTLTRQKTNGSGFFAFRSLRSGRYNLKVLPYGTNYEEQTRSVSLIGVSAIPGSGSISEQVDFYLPLKKDVSIGPLAAPGVIFAQEIPPSAKKLYEEGIKFLADKKENEGFESLKKALETFPEYYLALDRLGTEYVVRGYYRPAYVLLSKALEVNPRSFSSALGFGITQFRLGEIEKSIKTLEQATQLYRESTLAHLWLGIALGESGKFAFAEESLKKADKLSNGKSSDVHWQLARLYNKQNRYLEAADELELYLKYNPEAKNKKDIEETIAKLREKE